VEEENIVIPQEILNELDCTAEARIGYYSVDLNSDNMDEFIVSPVSGCLGYEYVLRGASGNGPIYIYQNIDSEWVNIGELNGNSLTVRSSKTNDYYDLVSYYHMSPIDGGEDLFQYDGSYKEVSERDVAGVAKKDYSNGITKYYIDEDKITFVVYNGLSFKEYTMESALAPELFNNILQKIIIIHELNTNTEETYLLITDNYSDHGGYATRQAIVYDLERDKVLYESNDYLREGWYAGVETLDNGDFHISYYHTQLGWGMQNKLKFDQYYAVDTENNDVISVNTNYKETFEKTLANIVDACIVEVSSPYASENEKLTFEQVKKEYGEDFECKIPDEGSGLIYKSNLYGNEGVITPRKYFLYINALWDIVKGNEVDLTTLDIN
jgi:hypothetical protein